MTKNDARIEVRLPSELKEEVAAYAKQSNVKISVLVVRLLTALIKADKEKRRPPDAEQI